MTKNAPKPRRQHEWFLVFASHTYVCMHCKTEVFESELAELSKAEAKARMAETCGISAPVIHLGPRRFAKLIDPIVESLSGALDE